MLIVNYSSRFKKDLKACVKRGCDPLRLQQVIDTLRIPAALPAKNAAHNLSGNYSGFQECHIAPDWLLIYRQDETTLFLYRTGTHSDLFGM